MKKSPQNPSMHFRIGLISSVAATITSNINSGGFPIFQRRFYRNPIETLRLKNLNVNTMYVSMDVCHQT